MKFRFAWNSSDNSSHSKFHHRSGSSSSVKHSVERSTKWIFPEPNRAEDYRRLDNNNYHLIWHCLDERFRRDINRFAPLNCRTANSLKTNYRKNVKEKTDSESRLPFSEKGTGKKAKTRKKENNIFMTNHSDLILFVSSLCQVISKIDNVLTCHPFGWIRRWARFILVWSIAEQSSKSKPLFIFYNPIGMKSMNESTDRIYLPVIDYCRFHWCANTGAPVIDEKNNLWAFYFFILIKLHYVRLNANPFSENPFNWRLIMLMEYSVSYSSWLETLLQYGIIDYYSFDDVRIRFRAA